MAVVLDELDQGAAGHARQDVAGQGRGFHVAVLVHDHHVHAAKLLKVGLGGGVDEAHLLAAVVDAGVLTKQGCGVVATALGETSAARAGAEPLVFNPDADRLHTAREVRSGRGGNHAIIHFLRSAHAKERLGSEHERTHVQRVFATGRNPIHIALDEGGDRADEVVDRQLRQVQTLGGVLETLGVRIRTEQPSGAVGVTIGLQTFEAFLGVMQNRCARIHLQRRVRLDAAVRPAFTLGPGHVGHVVGEDLTESRLVDEFGALGVGCRVVVREHGELLGELVKLRRIVMILFSHSLLLLVASATQRRPAVIGLRRLWRRVLVCTLSHHKRFR